MLRLYKYPIILALVLTSQSLGQQPTPKSDSLKPYLKCEFDDGLYIKETTRRSASGKNFREVKMGDQTKTVSVIDGYRIMFAYRGAHYFFANVNTMWFFDDALDFAINRDATISERGADTQWTLANLKDTGRTALPRTYP